MEYCRYCNCLLTNNNRTKDHVPPKFIYKGIVTNEERYITIPCCKICNNYYSNIESQEADFFKNVVTNLATTPNTLRNHILSSATFRKLMEKIALGYFSNLISDNVNEIQIKKVHFFVKGIDDYDIENFKKIEFLEICPDIGPFGNNIPLITDNPNIYPKVFHNSGNLFNEHFWCYFDNNLNAIKFAFFDRIFVIAYFSKHIDLYK